MKKLFLLAMIVLGTSLAQAQMHDMPMDEMDSMMMLPDRTEGLVVLGTTGMTKEFANEQMMMGKMASYKGKVSGAFTSTDHFSTLLTKKEMRKNAGFFGFAPEIAIVDGMTYRMVAPSVHPDNFMVKDAMGNVKRYDLGVDEGTNMITLVSEHKMMK